MLDQPAESWDHPPVECLEESNVAVACHQLDVGALIIKQSRVRIEVIRCQ